MRGSSLATRCGRRRGDENKRDCAVLARVRIVRAQAESPFEGWRTSGLGAHRKTPQLWATLTQPAGSEPTTVMLQLGLYPSSSAELAAARAAFDSLVADLKL